jgi:Uma2 family endonuclease
MTDHAPILSTPVPVRLRVSDYLTLDAAGALDAYGRTELINGEIYAMNAQHRPHARIKSRLSFTLHKLVQELGLGLEVLIEATIEMGPLNAPEPDIILTSAADGDQLVPFDSVALVVEVSDSSLQHDFHRKADLYSRFNVPEYWIVDVQARAIHQMWNPGPGGYRQSRNILFGGDVASETLPNLIVPTTGLG